MSKVLLFTSQSCVPCKALKAYLKSHNHEAEELDIESPTGSLKARMYRVRSVPTLVRVDDSEGMLDYLIGFNVKQTEDFYSV